MISEKNKSKKYNKIIKFIFVNILIFSFIMPTFATLTNSDGSSFVTKAEFDSELAVFSSKLTEFEAGINSKIDSQVTSYLDRNGIWSGKNQTIKKQHLVFAYGIAVNTNLNYNDGKTLPVDLMGFNDLGAFSAGLSYVIRNNLYQLTEDINKTGLCCLKYAVKSNGANLKDSYFTSASQRRGWRYKMDSSKSPNNVCSWDPNIYIYQPVSYDIASRDISLSVGSFRPYTITYFIDKDNASAGYFFTCQPFDSAGCLYFFVSKGHPLYFVEYQSLTLHSGNSASSLSGQGKQLLGNNYVGFRVDFNSIVVY